MDLLITLGTFTLGLLINEAVEISPWMARKVIRWSAYRLPDPVAARDQEEEWTALLSERPGKLLKLIYALTFICPALTMRRELRGQPSLVSRIRMRHLALWTSNAGTAWLCVSLGAFVPVQMWTERMPDSSGAPLLYYWIQGLFCASTLYTISGVITCKRQMRRLSALAHQGDEDALTQLVRLNEIVNGTRRRQPASPRRRRLGR